MTGICLSVTSAIPQSLKSRSSLASSTVWTQSGRLCPLRLVVIEGHRQILHLVAGNLLGLGIQRAVQGGEMAHRTQPRLTTTSPRLRSELLSVLRMPCQRSATGTQTEG